MESGTAESSRAGRPGRTLFHVVRGPSPAPADFGSLLGRGTVPRPRRDGQHDAEVLRQAAGVSCYETADQARATATRFRLGTYIAEVFIPDDGCAIEVARTGTREGHHTVWASPAYFASHVVSVQSV